MNTLSPNTSPLWSRAIILVDMNAFFASVEQRDCPEWRGRPLAIMNGDKGTCVIAASYEAKQCGVKTGMRFAEARRLCPDLIRVAAQPCNYARASRAIMKSLEVITPDIEVFSIDEAFLDVTHCQRLHGSPETIAALVKKRVFESSNLLCSIGVSGDKTTAKWAAKQQRPNGFTVVPPWESKARLHNVPVRELCGIGEGIERFLARHGVHTCGDMAHLPIGIVSQRFGNLGRRLWYMCQGADPDPLHLHASAPKSMGHGKVLPPGTRDPQLIWIYLRYLTERLAARLRRHHLEAQIFFVGLNASGNWCGGKVILETPCQEGKKIYDAGKTLLQKEWHQEPCYQIQVTALSPQPAGIQFDLFSSPNPRQQAKHNVIDGINTRYGEGTILPATLLHYSDMSPVIAPAWQPSGPRQTLYDV
jgi:DNA polymerase IV